MTSRKIRTSRAYQEGARQADGDENLSHTHEPPYSDWYAQGFLDRQNEIREVSKMIEARDSHPLAIVRDQADALAGRSKASVRELAVFIQQLAEYIIEKESN